MTSTRTMSLVLALWVLAGVSRVQAAVDFTTATPTGVQAHTVAFQNLTTGSIVSWEWEFGDGGTSNNKHPTHTYMEVGTYSVTLHAVGFGGAGGTVTKTDFITVTPASLTADFTTSVTSGDVPLTVDFSGSASGTGNITDWRWDFGDGKTGTGQVVQHVFKGSGTFTVALTVWAGEPVVTETKVDLVDVLPLDMLPSFSFTPASGHAPLDVHFTDTSTGPHNTWSWVFDDGPIPWWAALQDPTHTYVVPGVYDVSLTIGLVGTTDTATITIPGAVTVLDPGLTPGLSVFPRGGLSPLTVTLTDTSTAAVPFTRDLDFGDLTQHSPLVVSTHVYSGTRPFTPVQTITTIPGPNQAEFELTNGVECVEPEVATFSSFDAPEPSFLGGETSFLTLADFSGDGLPDLLVEWPGTSSVPSFTARVFVQAGGSFTVVPKTFQTYQRHDQRDVAGVSDMDGDGDLDLVVAAANYGIDVGIWRNDGSGGFTLASSTALPETPTPQSTVTTWAAVLDVDLDGKTDVVAGADDLLTVLRGAGNGHVASVSPVGEALSFVVHPTVADVDHDGFADLVGQVDGGIVRVVSGDGVGFAPSVPYVFDAGATDADLAVGDVTGDGFVDLVVHDDGDLLVAPGTGAGFGAFVGHALPFGIGPRPQLGDLDGDGRADMLSAHLREARATRFDVSGAPDFSSGLRRLATAETVSEQVLADVDADGRLDVVTRYEKAPTMPQKIVTLHRNLGVIGRWVDVGGEMQGPSGLLHFDAQGELRPGTPVTLVLSGSAPGATAFLVIGLSQLHAPFKGGVLVPSPDAVVAGPVDGTGGATWPATWPAGVPAGTPSWHQFWVSEGGVLAGSNGLLAIAAD